MCDNRLGACSHGSNMVVFSLIPRPSPLSDLRGKRLLVVFVCCVKGEAILKLGYLYLKQDITT